MQHGEEPSLLPRRRLAPRVGPLHLRGTDQVEHLDVAIPGNLTVRRRVAHVDRLDVLRAAVVQVADRVDDGRDTGSISQWVTPFERPALPGAAPKCLRSSSIASCHSLQYSSALSYSRRRNASRASPGYLATFSRASLSHFSSAGVTGSRMPRPVPGAPLTHPRAGFQSGQYRNSRRQRHAPLQALSCAERRHASLVERRPEVHGLAPDEDELPLEVCDFREDGPDVDVCDIRHSSGLVPRRLMRAFANVK